MPLSSPQGNATRKRCQPWLGTFVEITAAHADDDLLRRAFGAVATVHERMSFHAQHSDLAALRHATPGKRVRIHPDTVSVLRFAIDLYRRSHGIFDVAVAAKLVASGFLPRPPGVDLRRMTGTSADIEIVSDRDVILHRPMLIDLGGIAKGFAVDNATRLLIDAGMTHAVVNAGGDLRVVGETRIHLRDGDGAIRRSLVLSDAALATSANRHTRRQRDGTTWVPHLDAQRMPRPIDHAISVIADECMTADALTKVALVAPPEAERLASTYAARIVPLEPSTGADH
ncbi:thiamine biosynthesis lipoprotein [Luteibacter sp. 621]|jgi:thiamine biosynthesis lipoprotein|uniref:FAD:protein FMN transferase n=1 Tax=Luteibacter sp. 621 TaxID=3373916 RepID=UPI003D235890